MQHFVAVRFVSLTLIIVCLGTAVPAFAAPFVPRVFGLEEAFLRAAAIVSTETFDDLATGSIIGTGAVVVDGIEYSSDDPTSRWIAGIYRKCLGTAIETHPSVSGRGTSDER